jgi:hypothetical protein
MAQARDNHYRFVCRHPWLPWEPFDSLSREEQTAWLDRPPTPEQKAENDLRDLAQQQKR